MSVASTPAAAPALQRWAAHTDALRAAIAAREERPSSPEVARHARLVFLDTLGCALAGRLAPEVAAMEGQWAQLEPGGFRFPGGPPLGVRAACQIMAIGPTWHEACEGHPFAHGRPGIAAIAALLPLALHRDATVGEFIDALATGYEVGARAGGWLRLAPGIHADGNWPGLGVAAGVSRLLGLPLESAMNAVAIAACQLPASLYLPIRTGRNVRNVYLAHSATLGLDSALAAQAGIAAPPDALAYYADHCCPAATEPLPDASADLILDAYLKPFAAVRHVHYGAVAARRIREKLGGRTSGIERIVLTIYEEAAVYCSNPQPTTPLAAQFSLTFGLAAMLRFGELNAASYEQPQFDDGEMRRLEALVEVRIDRELTRAMQRGATLQVTAGGASFEEKVGPQPDAELMVDADGAIDKFAHNAAPGVPQSASRAFCAALLDCPPAQRMRGLWRMLETDARAHRLQPRQPGD
ncbi:MAG: MmgE/PrpD family protein [Ramlibacter sp.]